MNDLPGSLSEVRMLTSAMFDGQITATGMQQLERLIVNDPTCLQEYLVMVNLHGDLLHKADTRTDEEAALTVLRDFTLESAVRRRQHRNTLLASVGGVAALMCAAFSWYCVVAYQPASPLASIICLSNDVQVRSRKVELNQIIRQGETLSVTEGIVSLELDRVTLLDLVGPAELKLVSQKQVKLIKGNVAVHVNPGGEGFSVITPDAEIVDKGTKFLVRYEPGQGTYVAVQKGLVTVSSLSQDGSAAKRLDLTEGRAALASRSQSTLEETFERPPQSEKKGSGRGLIRVTTGHIRTSFTPPRTLENNKLTTSNYILLIPEQQKVVLSEDLTVGDQVISAGSTVSSYLVHYNPGTDARFSPSGSMSFSGVIAAVVTESSELNATDSIFGLSQLTYEKGVNRELELDEDEFQFSEDHRTIGFSLDISPENYLDEVRILILED